MPQWVGVLADGAAGAVVGGIGLSLLTLRFWALFSPAAFRDGQFALVFLATVPCGGMLGGAAGAALGLLGRGNTGSARWVALIGGALVAGLVAFFAFVWALGERGVDETLPDRPRPSRLRSALPLGRSADGLGCPPAAAVMRGALRGAERPRRRRNEGAQVAAAP